jgi:hypothetical protein
LLERIKDLEAKADPVHFGHERPQTANILSKMCKYLLLSDCVEASNEGRRIGEQLIQTEVRPQNKNVLGREKQLNG